MKRTRSRTLILVVIFAFGLVGVLFFVNQESDQAEYTKTTIPVKKTIQKADTRYSYPVRLKIDAIGVNAKVQYVGMTASGDLATPSNITDVGWYKLGARPGNPGSAVLDGHFNGPQGQAGVFSELTSLKKGDKVTTIDSKGEKAVFRVTSLKTYGGDEKPNEVFKSNDKDAHLNLITCSGDWNADQRQYSTRTVVFTSKLQ